MLIPCWEWHGERAIEDQKCIEVSLACVYDCSLVVKTENRSLSKAINISNDTMSLDGCPCLIRDYLSLNWETLSQI